MCILFFSWFTNVDIFHPGFIPWKVFRGFPVGNKLRFSNLGDIPKSRLSKPTTATGFHTKEDVNIRTT